MKICTIVGARPQFIKAAPVSRAICQHMGVEEVLIHTGQHYDKNMSDVFFGELEIPHPDVHLKIGSSSHGKQTGRMLEGVEQVLLEHKPDWVLVYGDTNSTIAGSLAASKLHIPVAHVEAGLRSFNKKMPEEINRILTDHVSSLLLTPTKTADINLLNEGIDASKIINVGDVMYDAARYFADKAESKSSILEELELQSGGYILSTIHRAENTDDPRRLNIILKAFQSVSRERPLVLPLHPRTRDIIDRLGYSDRLEGIKVIDPVGYLDMVMLERHAALIATDSGGIQKEAFFHNVPCITLRDETEWVELIDLEWNRLAPPTDDKVLAKIILDSVGVKGKDGSPYGDGHAADRILESILNVAAR